jgi:hypothetical protein
MSKNYKYFYHPLVMSFGINFRGVGGQKDEGLSLTAFGLILWGLQPKEKALKPPSASCGVFYCSILTKASF